MKNKGEIILKPTKDNSLRRFHPWVFSGAIAHASEGLQEGDVVKVFANDGAFLGVGHYQTGSISVRILSFEDEPIDRDFYLQRLTEAYRLRLKADLIRPDNTIYRLVYGEGDNLPGLIIDMYGNTAVVQVHTVGMNRDRRLIVEALQEVVPSHAIEHIFYKSEATLAYTGDREFRDGYLMGGDKVNPVAVENGLKFHIDWLRGQKTGFFIDQRENRKLVERYAQDRRVLNLFCYTGGFSAYALRGGARKVDSVDSSAKAVMLTNKNIRLNFGEDARHGSCSEDAFKFLKKIEKDAYDLIILDPPAFAKHRGAIKNALQGYRKLNLAALEKIAPGGIIFTFSCSQAITREQFRVAVFSAAALSRRRVRIMYQLEQPVDHPINMYHPEGEYLKGLVLYVV